jgi:O-antigen ligase
MHGTIIGMAVWLLRTCDSMTSLACILLGTGLMMMTGTAKPRLTFIRVVVPLALVASFLFVFYGGPLLTLIGRDPTLTGRTDLWNLIIPMNPNPLLGCGFASFWLGERLAKIWELSWWHPNQAHNGYIETYLDLGLLGLALIFGILVNGYRRIVKLLTLDPPMGRVRLAFFVVAVVYNFTEAAIRMVHPVWLVFLLATIVVPESKAVKDRVLVARVWRTREPAPQLKRVAPVGTRKWALTQALRFRSA